MPLKKLKISLLILASVLPILLQGQTDSGKICLPYAEFDFYAQALVERDGLKSDTSIMVSQIKDQGLIIQNKDKQLQNDKVIFSQQDSIIDVKTKAFEDLVKKYDKQGKKIRRFQKITLVLAITSIVLGIVVLLK